MTRCAAVADKKIRVLSYTIVANDTVNAMWQSHITPTENRARPRGARLRGL